MENQKQIIEQLRKNNNIIACLCLFCMLISIATSLLTAYIFNMMNAFAAIMTLCLVILTVLICVVYGFTRGARNAIENRG